jgi:hypothetical protein
MKDEKNAAYNWNLSSDIAVGTKNRKPQIVIRVNGGTHLNAALAKNSDLYDKEYVKAKKLDSPNNIIVGLIFSNKEEVGKTVKLGWSKDDEGNKKNAGFSGKAMFQNAGVNLKKGPFKIEPKIQDYEGNKIFILEIPKS